MADRFKHIEGKVTVKNSLICQKCINRLYCKDKDKPVFGIGNLNPKYTFVVNHYNVNNIHLENNIYNILSTIYKEITGINMNEDVYLTRLIKCPLLKNQDVYKNAVMGCNDNIVSELYRFKHSKIIFFGSAYYDFIEANVSNINIINSLNHSICYNPLMTLFTNNDNRDKFIKDLTSALYIL